MGNKLNSRGVKGLEIVTVDASGIHRLKPEGIEALEVSASEIDKSLEKWITQPFDLSNRLA